jgi:serine phosphatase RsbU (regulator of sigma subunit)
MADARLKIHDATGSRLVMLDQPVFTIGRRRGANLRCDSGDVSREHATILRDGDRYLLRDCGSRCGTYVNGDRIEERLLVDGDCIQLGSSRAMEILFQTGDTSLRSLTHVSSGVADLKQLAAIMDIMRALGSGRVLDDVLSLVVDAALDVTKAERGFVMLVNDRDELELTVARGRSRQPLTGSSFATSVKIPRDVFKTGRSQFVEDLERQPGHEYTMAMGIRHVICVPLRVAAIATTTHAVADHGRIIGVLYVDGPGRGSGNSSSALSSLEAFATQATLAIESARLYAEEAEKARIDRDLHVAADIQRALFAEPLYTGSFCNLAATSLPCRTIGGDFYDYFEVGDGAFAFALGDVAGKGPPAALLAAAVQSHFVAQASTGGDPAETLARINRALLRRMIEARFATMFHAVLAADGRLSYSNGGHEPPVVVGRDRVESLDLGGGPVLGLLTEASYTSASVQLRSNDTVVICSDGVTEAVNAQGEEFGRTRLLEAIGQHRGATVDKMLDGVLLALRNFSQGAPQADDITLLVVRYTPSQRAETFA